MTTAQGESSATTQATLWGARADDWTRIQEPQSRPLYEVVFRQTNVGPDVALLDLGCGSGVASALAARLGASVAGLDATAELIIIARTRAPACEFRVGELEAPPYADGAFDVVVGFSSFQYVADPVNALSQARRVARPGAVVAIATWGKPEECEAAGYLAALGRLLPPPPPGTPGPFAFSTDGALEALTSEAGLKPGEAGAVPCPWAYPDLDTALRGLLSAGPAVRAITAAGEDRVRSAVAEAIDRFRTSDGSYRIGCTFRYLIATA
jgi:SAM-dependent methyltransferase